MDHARELFDDLSDRVSDIAESPRGIAEQPRLSRLGSNIPIPDSDIPMSEANDQVFAMAHVDFHDATAQHLHEVDVINSMIVHNSKVQALSDTPSSRVLPSATPGKLLKPRSNLVKLPRGKRTVLRGDQFEVELSPEKGLPQGQVHSGANHAFSDQRPQAPLAKRQRTKSVLDYRPEIRNIDIANSLPGPSKNDGPGRVLRSRTVVGSQPSPKRVSRATRFAKHAKSSLLSRSRANPAINNSPNHMGSDRPPTLADNLEIQRDIPAFPPNPETTGSPRPSQAAHSMLPANRGQSTPNDEAQESEPKDTHSSVGLASNRTDVQSQAHMREQDPQRAETIISEASFENGDTDIEDSQDEAEHSGDMNLPDKLHEALEYAYDVHTVADNDLVPQSFEDIRVYKHYNDMKKKINLWKSKSDHSHSDGLIGLSNKLVEEARAILVKPNWKTTRGLRYINQRILPTLVRMLYISLAYHLTKAGVLRKLSYEQLKVSRSLVKAIVHLAEQGNQPNITRPQSVIRMVAGIKCVRSQLDNGLRALKQTKQANLHAQRQQARRSHQHAEDLEEQDILKLRKWRDHWRVLHEQRRGAELEGRITLGDKKNLHLKSVPLSDSHLVEYPYWDPNHIYLLAEGLEKFAGPDVYRNIFRTYCHYGGPLSAFNVSEIVDKAVALRDQLIKLTLEDGEEVENWIRNIPDPRKPPTITFQ